MDVIPGDIAFRCNFSTADENGIVTDRRAGRIREGTHEIVEVLNTMVLTLKLFLKNQLATEQF